MNSGQRLGERGCPDPVHFRAESLRGANRMHVVIDQPRNDRAALQINHARFRTRQFFHFRAAAEGYDPAVADGQRFARGKLIVHGQDFAVQEDGVGIL